MDQKRIMGVLEKVAVENGVPLDTVIDEIEKIIDIGISSQDHLVRRRWESIPHQGKRPTVLELVSFLIEQVQHDMGM